MPGAPTLTELAAAIRARKTSAAELTRAALDAADSANRSLNAFLQLFTDQALAHAKSIDALVARGEDPGPLAGIPIALKDNICLAGLDGATYSGGRTTAGSRILENYRSPFTATAADRLLRAGAIIFGKTNMDEFGMGSSGENSAFGPTRHPFDPARISGGSSSGSAAAVAAGIVPGALGSDTGGSVRQPAGLCGIVGVKPTYGRVSRYGLIAYASSLDQIGPLARTVEDAALLLSVIAGPDPHDSTCTNKPAPDFTARINEPISGLRVGVPREARSDSNHPDVNAALDRAIESLRAQGAQIVNVELPHLKYGVAAYYIVAPAEASSNLARFDGVRYGRRAELGPKEDLFALYARSRAEGFGAEVQRRIMLGTYALSSGYYDAYYLRALKVRRLIKQDFDRVFDKSGSATSGGCDVILMPTSPHPAWKIGEKTGDPWSVYLEDVYTVVANMAGLPAMSVPVGTAKVAGAAAPLPVGVQIYAPAFEEETMLRAGRLIERSAAP